MLPHRVEMRRRPRRQRGGGLHHHCDVATAVLGYRTCLLSCVSGYVRTGPGIAASRGLVKRIRPKHLGTPDWEDSSPGNLIRGVPSCWMCKVYPHLPPFNDTCFSLVCVISAVKCHILMSPSGACVCRLAAYVSASLVRYERTRACSVCPRLLVLPPLLLGTLIKKGQACRGRGRRRPRPRASDEIHA